MNKTSDSTVDNKVDKHNPFEGPTVIKAVPSSESQKEIWASIELSPKASLAYNESIRVKLEGELEIETLVAAINRVVTRHDSLRGVFSNDGKAFLITDGQNFEVKIFDYITSDLDSKIQEHARLETSTEFNLKQGPVFRSSILKFSDNLHYLFLSGHHIVCDGWSMAVIVNEISVTYSELLSNKKLSLSAPTQFSDYIVNKIKNEGSDKDFWVEKYKANIPELNLPCDFQRPEFRTFESERIDYLINPSKVKELKKWGAKQGNSYYVTLMGVFNILLSKLTSQEEIIVGISSAEQSHIGKYDLVGHLVNLLPINQNISNQQNIETVFKELKTLMLDAMDHQSFTFGSLLNELNIKRDPSKIPLINVIFNVDQQYPGQGLEFEKINASYESNPRFFENFEIFINATSCGDHLVLECQYNKNLFKPETIKNWLASYDKIIDLLLLNKSLINEIILPDLLIPSSEVKTEKIVKNVEVSFSDEENFVCSVWEKVLGLSDIPRDINFFTLGGHSLLGAEVINFINKEYDLSLTLKDLFQAPTIAELALKCSNQEKVDNNKIIHYKLSENAPVDLSTSQFRSWYVEQLTPGTTVHNLPSSIIVRGDLSKMILEKSLQTLIARHESLRTVFKSVNGKPKQFVKDKVLFNLEEIKLKRSGLQEALNNEADFVFDLESAPLIRAKLFKTDDNCSVFFFMAHHAIWDGWCFDIFFSELHEIYQSLLDGKIPTLTTLPEVNYRDFTLWQQENISSGKYNDEINFWKNNLASPLPILELPTDFNRPNILNNSAGSVPFTINADLNVDLKKLAKDEGTSLYNIFLAAFNLTLSVLTGENDIIVGTPVRGREFPELNNIIGYFVNTIAIRTNLNQAKQTYSSVINNTMKAVTNGFGHQKIPFEKVLEHVKFDRDQSRTPIYQAFFSYQDVTNRSAQLGPFNYEQINIEKGATHTDLDLWIKTSNSKIEGAFEYRHDLFKNITVTRFKEIFENILIQMCKESNKIISNDNLIPESHKDLLFNVWNNTEADNSILFLEQFHTVVNSHPEKVAIIADETTSSMSYSELDLVSSTWAKSLNEQGVQQGDLIGLSINRGHEMIISLLAILKAGAGYVPLDPGFPQDRLDYMVESSKINHMIASDDLAQRFTQDIRIQKISDFTNLQILKESYSNKLNSKDTAYVIYTSGSTGLPKGVELSHGAMANFLSSMKHTPGISANDNLLAVTTLSFDIAVLELYLPLISGAGIRIASKSEAMDGHELKSIIGKNNINYMQATPSTWRLLLASGWTADSEFTVLCGGEPFPKDLSKKLLENNANVWNMYGPTETTVWSTCKKLSMNEDIISVGRPIDNTDILILDDDKNIVPIGRSGNLFIGGEGLAKGYFGREDLTAERFIQNPYDKNKRIYDTGDLARYHANGEIECLGRNDGQVKVRGYRIELSEIEAVFASYNSDLECVVITREDKPGDVRIVAYYVGLEDLNPIELRGVLAKKLPPYMIPSHFVRMDKFPKTLNNKIDKKSLPAPIIADSTETKTVHITTESSVFSRLESIWKDVLGLSEIPAEESFFNLGGQSLLAVEMFARIYTEFNINLSINELFGADTLEQLAKKVEAKIDPVVKIESFTNTIPTLQSNLVAIKQNGNLTPVICFHGAGGNVLNYVKLATLVEAQRPVYGMKCPGVEVNTDMPKSISELVELYTNEILRLLPNQSFILAGGSMGGVLAMEVAIKLKEHGRQIDNLIMFDTIGPNFDLNKFGHEDLSKIEIIKHKISYKWEAFVNKMKVGLLSMLGIDLPHKLKYYYLELNNYKLINNHVYGHYNGDITMIRAMRKSSGIYSDPKLGWDKAFTGKMNSIEVEGTHDDFLESTSFTTAFSSLFKES